jgi:hypothetical protein
MSKLKKYDTEKSCLVKITDEMFVRKADVLAVYPSTHGGHKTLISMKHDVFVPITYLTPQQVLNRLDGLDE